MEHSVENAQMSNRTQYTTFAELSNRANTTQKNGMTTSQNNPEFKKSDMGTNNRVDHTDRLNHTGIYSNIDSDELDRTDVDVKHTNGVSCTASTSNSNGNHATTANPNGNHATTANPNGNHATASNPNGNNATMSNPTGNNATMSNPTGNNTAYHQIGSHLEPAVPLTREERMLLMMFKQATNIWKNNRKLKPAEKKNLEDEWISETAKTVNLSGDLLKFILH